MIMRLIHFALFVTLALGSAPALAVQPDEVMKNPALEARARALSEELRCLVCQNQSIDDSDAPLARDIRILIRSRIAQRRKQRRGAGVSRLALRRLHSPQAAVQARDHALVAEPGVGPRRRPRRRALRPPPRAPVDARAQRRGRSAARGAYGRRHNRWVTCNGSAIPGFGAVTPAHVRGFNSSCLPVLIQSIVRSHASSLPHPWCASRLREFVQQGRDGEDPNDRRSGLLDLSGRSDFVFWPI